MGHRQWALGKIKSFSPIAYRPKPNKMLDSDSIKTMKQLGEYSSLGIQMVVIIAIFGGIGWWIDSRFSLKPWGMLIGCLFGAGGGMYFFIRAILRANLEAGEEEEGTGNGKKKQ